MYSVCRLVGGKGVGGVPHSPIPTQSQNTIFPPTHHSLLGGQSLAKLSTKIKLRCRLLPIALNRADWIRIFPFSSHLDHLGHWGPGGRLGPGGGRGQRLPKPAQHFSALEPWGEGADAPPPHPLPQQGVHSLPVHSALRSGLGHTRLCWVLLSSVYFLAN